MPDVVFPYPVGGMNEMYPPHLIGDDTFADLVNMYYNPSGKLVSRPGTEWVARFTNQVWSIGGMPDQRVVVAQIGSELQGRSAVAFGDMQFHVIKTGVAQGWRYFANMNGIIYSGTEIGSATTDNLKWNPTTTAAVTWPGPSVPFSYLCTWNGRMWAVHRTLKTRLYFSKLGDPEDWTTTGISGAGFIDVGYNDGQVITGIVVHNEQLFILKERSVYHIVTANPNTDNTGWRVEYLTTNFGCSSQNGICVCGTDVVIPTSYGMVGLDAALYQGDFRTTKYSAAIDYGAGGDIARVFQTDEYAYVVSWKPQRFIYCFQKAGGNARWYRMDIRDTAGNRVQPITISTGFNPAAWYGEFYGGRNVSQTTAMIVVWSNSGYYDLLQYPSTKQGSDGHWDYIDGPDGEVPIRKYFKTRMHNFGNFGYEKRSRMARFTYSMNDREPVITGNTFTLSAIFDGNDNNEKQTFTINDTGTEVMGPENDIRTNLNRSPIRTAVVGLGGAQGRVYKGIQYEMINNIGGYEFQYDSLEMDVEQIGKFPKSSEHVLV